MGIFNYQVEIKVVLLTVKHPEKVKGNGLKVVFFVEIIVHYTEGLVENHGIVVDSSSTVLFTFTMVDIYC